MVPPKPVHCVPFVEYAIEVLPYPYPTATHKLEPLFKIAEPTVENIIAPKPVHVVPSNE